MRFDNSVDSKPANGTAKNAIYFQDFFASLASL